MLKSASMTSVLRDVAYTLLFPHLPPPSPPLSSPAHHHNLNGRLRITSIFQLEYFGRASGGVAGRRGGADSLEMNGFVLRCVVAVGTGRWRAGAALRSGRAVAIGAGRWRARAHTAPAHSEFHPFSHFHDDFDDEIECY